MSLIGRILAGGAGTTLLCVAVFLALDTAFPLPEDWLVRPQSTQVLDRAGEPLRFFLAADERWRFPCELEDIDPDLVRTVIHSEDRWFWAHPGVNPLAIARAAWQNLVAGRVVSGGSTITMQLARMAEPRRRTLTAKLVEAFRALQLERRYAKQELLAAYLGMIPMGGNVEGVCAASWFYFGKGPERLSLAEASLLAVIPRNPASYDPTIDARSATVARDRLLASMAEAGACTGSAAARAMAAPAPTSRRPAPFFAPHVARLARERHPDRDVLTTSIDATAQRAVVRAVRSRLADLKRMGVGDASVVVIDNASREIRAMLGAADYFGAPQGRINAALARRSPGSTLKPFLYGLGMDRGVVVPGSVLLDIPTDYAGYTAENYDGRYRGAVRASRALLDSLNAPAVRLLAELGTADFHELLQVGGLDLARDPGGYGLPLALGACEVRLVDLTALYAMLAAGGTYAPWRLVPQDAAPRRLLSPEAAHLVLDMLHERERPGLAGNWELAADAPAVAWKTGTSHGHRDAWAIGVAGGHTVGVWVGNLDGTPVTGISGADFAGPLLFDVIRAVERPGSRLPEAARLELAEATTCAGTGLLPGPYCPEEERITIIPGVTRLRRENEYRRIFLDVDSRLALSGDCLAGRTVTERIVRQRAPELTAWLRAQGRGVDMPPPHPDCPAAAGRPPAIVSPSPATPYRLRADAPARYQSIALTARADAAVRRLFWYANGAYVGTAAPGEPVLWSPTPGEAHIVAVDDAGLADAVTIVVEGGGFGLYTAARGD